MLLSMRVLGSARGHVMTTRFARFLVFYSIVKQPDACLQTCVIAPVLISARGSPSSFSSFSPSGRAERWAKRPRPRRPHVLHASTPYDVVLATSYGGPARRSRETTHGEAQLNVEKPLSRTASEAVFTCVPHANGFYGLLDVPGMAAYASVPPFVRAVARTCTRAVRLSHRCLCPPAVYALGARCQYGPSHPAVTPRRQSKRAL
jgi:hypothetical protein